MWRQGDHVLLLGATGTGKTTFANPLLAMRKAVVMLATKDDDVHRPGWRTVTSTDEIDIRKALKWRLMPEYERQGVEFNALFQRVWREGCWAVYVDELYHVQDLWSSTDRKTRVQVGHLIDKLYTQGRAKKITVIGGSQRPAWVSKFPFSEARYVICFRLGLGDDVKKVRDNFGKDFAAQVEKLQRFEYAWMDKVTGRTGNGKLATIGEIFK